MDQMRSMCHVCGSELSKVSNGNKSHQIEIISKLNDGAIFFFFLVKNGAILLH